MTDYIKRDDAIEVYSELYWMHEGLLNFQEELGKVYDEILGIPPADVVPVVRCKDCKYFKSQTENTGVCDGGFCHAPVYCSVRDFCSNGEREDDE